MFCSKCGTENVEESSFCSNCGFKLIENKHEKNSRISKIKDKYETLKKKSGINILWSSLVIALVISLVCIYMNNPISKFKSQIQNNKYSEAVNIYNSKIKGNIKKEEEIYNFLKNEIDTTEKNFLDGSLKYDIAKIKLETIRNTNLMPSQSDVALKKINKLNDSTVAFEKGEKLLASGDILNAINEYKNVIEIDNHYTKAQEQIKANEEQYKELLAKNIEEENQKHEKMKANQLVIVEKSEIAVQDVEYKSLYPDMIAVIITNKSDKTIKDIEVGSLAYDKNGYPIKIKPKHGSSNAPFEFIGIAENANVVSGAKFGSDHGWSLDESHGISKVLSCVKNVTFYDGTTWDNEYYEYWIEKYKEKPLK